MVYNFCNKTNFFIYDVFIVTKILQAFAMYSPVMYFYIL